jgi:hypothetical protein
LRSRHADLRSGSPIGYRAAGPEPRPDPPQPTGDAPDASPVRRLLDQLRGPDGWRCVVTYSTGPGMRYLRAYPAEELRRADKPAGSYAEPTKGIARPTTAMPAS